MMTTTMMAKERFQILGNNQRTSKSFFRQTSSYFLAGSKEGRNSWLRNVKCFKSIHLHQGVQPNKKLILWHQKKGKSGFNSEFEFQKLFANSKLTIIIQVPTFTSVLYFPCIRMSFQGLFRIMIWKAMLKGKWWKSGSFLGNSCVLEASEKTACAKKRDQSYF